jgi:hypothetical protein
MQNRDPSSEGFLHRGRIVYSVMYALEGGSDLIVWFDRGGNDLNGRVVHSDRQRRIVTARPGDVILYKGQPRRVVSLEPYRQNWLSPAARAAHVVVPAHAAAAQRSTVPR